MWYDSIGVPEDGQTLDYGFQMKVRWVWFCGNHMMLSMQAAASPGEEPEASDMPPPDDAFVMVALDHWEDKVHVDIPFTPSPPVSGIGGIWRPLGAGENPSFPRHSMTGRPSADSAMLGGEQSPQKSLFPIDNYQLVYGRWEDDVIWNSQAVEQIPTPSLAQIDPNDPNFIIGIPEESPALAHSIPGDKDSRKVCVGHACIMCVMWCPMALGVEERQPVWQCCPWQACS